MKLLKILAGVMVLLLAGTVLADPDTSKSKSMSRGFSSNKSTATATSSKPKSSSSFGSFGRQTPSANDSTRSNSAANRDLARSSAEKNAMRNYEQRRQATQQTPSVNGNASPYPNQQPAPVIVQQQGSNTNGVLTGILLGQAMSRPHRDYPQQQNGGKLEPVTTDGEFKQGAINGDGQTLPASTRNVRSSGFPWFSFLFWTGLIVLVIWYARHKWMQRQAAQAAQAEQVHYSLERG